MENKSGFETIFITRAEVDTAILSDLKKKLDDVITRFKGETVLSEDWGKRRLAYPIKKETRGYYTYLAYAGEPEVVAEMERVLRLNESVLKFLTIRLSTRFNKPEFLKSYVSYPKQKREETPTDKYERGSYDNRSR